MDLENAKEQFQKYVETFDVKEKFIHLKLEHSYRVMEISKELATRLHLSEEQIHLATLIGLLHDIGRFYQIEKIRGFNDQKFDHSDYGVMYLFEEGHIRDFIKDKKYDGIIKKAIQYHNDISLKKGLTKEENLFCEIIRDADKIDIYKVYVEEFQHAWFHLEISSNVLENFRKRQLISLQDKKTKSDTVMVVLAFLFDFNFQESFDILKEKGYFMDYVRHVQVSPKSKKEWEELVQFCEKIIERRDMNA